MSARMLEIYVQETMVETLLMDLPGHHREVVSSGRLAGRCARLTQALVLPPPTPTTDFAEKVVDRRPLSCFAVVQCWQRRYFTL